MSTQFADGKPVNVEPAFYEETLQAGFYGVENFPSETERKIKSETILNLALFLRRHKGNPALTLDAMLFAVSSPFLMGASETQIAKRYHITKQAFSKRVVQVAKELGLGTALGMRGDKAQEAYATSAKKSHNAKKETLPQ